MWVANFGQTIKMSCSSCEKTKPVYICGEDLILASGLTSNAAYSGIDIYIYDATLDKYYRQSTVLQSGQAILDFTDLEEGIFQPEHEYDIWVTELDEPNNKLDLVYGTGSAARSTDCLNVPFLRLTDNNGDSDGISSQEIELEDD